MAVAAYVLVSCHQHNILRSLSRTGASCCGSGVPPPVRHFHPVHYRCTIPVPRMCRAFVPLSAHTREISSRGSAHWPRAPFSLEALGAKRAGRLSEVRLRWPDPNRDGRTHTRAGGAFRARTLRRVRPSVSSIGVRGGRGRSGGARANRAYACRTNTLRYSCASWKSSPAPQLGRFTMNSERAHMKSASPPNGASRSEARSCSARACALDASSPSIAG